MLIIAEGLVKEYPMGSACLKALDGVSFSIAEGEFVAVMGPSGSGKSTLMNILGCLDRPTSGRYFLAGEDVAAMGDKELAATRNRRIGFVFQAFNLLPRLSALENVMLPMAYSKALRGEAVSRAMKALDAVGLASRSASKPKQLSGGEQQRVAIARALVTEPDLVLADEPTGNLDSKNSAEIMRTLSALNAEGRTVVLVTHDKDVASWARRRITFKDGMIEEDMRRSGRGEPDED